MILVKARIRKERDFISSGPISAYAYLQIDSQLSLVVGFRLINLTDAVKYSLTDASYPKFN